MDISEYIINIKYLFQQKGKMGGLCPKGMSTALPEMEKLQEMPKLELGQEEELMKKAGTVVLEAADVLDKSEEKVKLVGEIIYRAYSMALFVKMKDVKHAIWEASQCWKALNKIIGKSGGSDSDPDAMEKSILGDLGDLYDFLEKITLKPVKSAISTLNVIPVPPAKAVKSVLTRAKEFIEKALAVLECIKKFFEYIFKAYHSLKDGDLAEKADEIINIAFDVLNEVESMFKGEKDEKPLQKDNPMTRYRLKVRIILDKIESMGLRIGDMAGNLSKYGTAMQNGCVPLVKVILFGVAEELKKGSDLDKILEDSKHYAGQSLTHVVYSVANSEWENVLKYSEKAFSDRVNKKVQEWVGYVLPMVYDGFTGDDVYLYQKVLKVKQWYVRLYELFQETKDLLIQNSDKFRSMDKYLVGKDLKALAAEMTKAVEMTDKTMLYIEKYNLLLKRLPKLCKFIILENEEECRAVRGRMLVDLQMVDDQSLNEQLRELMEPMASAILEVNTAYEECGEHIKKTVG